ncbi:MAG: hypothetical protein ACYC7E_16600 [Armatimonadota bacterium]
MFDASTLPQFEMLGQFIGRGSAPARLVGPGPDGSERFYVNYFYHESTDLVAYHPDSDAYDVWTSTQGGAWAMEVSPQGRLYLGTFHQGHVLKLDPQTGEFSDLGQAIPDEGFLWTLTLATDGMLYGGTSSNAHLLRVDPATDVITDLGRVDPTECYLRVLCAGPDGWVYGSVGCGRADFIAYLPATGELRHLLPESERQEGFTTIFLGEDGLVYGSYMEKHYALRDGMLVGIPVLPPAKDRTRWRDGRQAVESAGYPGSAMVIHRVGAGPDGKIYASSIQPEYLLRYDPTTGDCSNLGQLPSAEAYSLLAAYGKLFIASYTLSRLYIYDPSQPVNPGTERSNNPAYYGPVAPHQQRPYDMVMGADGKIYIANVAGYGYLDGAIAWYDPQTDSVAYVSNPLGEESVTSLCPLPDGRLVAASALLGGGRAVAATDARLFLWDPETKAVVAGPIAPIPGEPEITNLTLGGDGLLYGSACQQLIVLEPSSLEVLARGRSPQSHIRRAGMLTLDDGRVVALAGSMAVFLNYADGNLQIEPFAADEAWPWVGKAVLDGYLYAGSGRELIRCRIPGCA